MQLFRVELSRHGYTSAMILAEDAADAHAWAKREGESLFDDDRDEIDVEYPAMIGQDDTCSYDELHNAPFLTDAALALAEQESVWNGTCDEILTELRQRAENARLDAEAEKRQVKLSF
jgi:hypothetical protein